MNKDLLKINNSKCKICYACVRACPVKAIEVKINSEYPRIIPDRCIGCGNCVQVCGVDAIDVMDSTNEVKKLIASDAKVAAICAPSISGEFVDISDYRKFVEMIRALGFDYVNEVSFGVDVVAREYKKQVDNFKGKHYLFANCPAIVSLVEKYHPDLLHNMSPIVSPMIATTKIVRKKYGADVKVVYIGPCIASKEEAKRYEGEGKVDAVMTFRELRKLFESKNLKEDSLEFSEFDPPLGHKGSLYPVSNGIVQAVDMDEDLLTTKIISTKGKTNSLAAVKEFEKYLKDIKHHFNIFYCGGCLMGPGMSRGGEKFKRRSVVIDYAKKRYTHFNQNEWQQHIEEYSEIDLSRKFVNDDHRLAIPSDEKIEEVLKTIGKEAHVEAVGCEACGYANCRDFAISVAQGLAKPDMCITYSLRSKMDYIKTLKHTNQKLAETKEALHKSEEQSRKEQQIAREALERTSMMLQKLPNGVVIIDDELKIVEANQSFIDILGEEAKEINEIIPGLSGADVKTMLPYNFYNLFTYVLENDDNIMNRDIHFEDRLFNISVFTLRRGKIVGAVIRDMYQPEVQREEVINRVTDVIDKNLQLVQQIGFILGEGAAETEKMLNSIIESYKITSGKKE